MRSAALRARRELAEGTRSSLSIDGFFLLFDSFSLLGAFLAMALFEKTKPMLK
jgi:hypothetical protein